jgi:hypothetical protein
MGRLERTKGLKKLLVQEYQILSASNNIERCKSWLACLGRRCNRIVRSELGWQDEKGGRFRKKAWGRVFDISDGYCS